MGRPSSYSPEIADAICERLADGESLRSICSDESMPCKSAVFRWLATNTDFADQYARAREEQAETLADEIVSIADESDTKAIPGADDSQVVVYDSTAVARNRLRVDARKWVASKLKPKKYGDRQILAGDPDAPLRMLSDEELDAKLTAKLQALDIRNG